jgi:hypothetical protein
MPTIATTTINSIKVNPEFFRIIMSPASSFGGGEILF